MNRFTKTDAEYTRQVSGPPSLYVENPRSVIVHVIAQHASLNDIVDAQPGDYCLRLNGSVYLCTPATIWQFTVNHPLGHSINSGKLSEQGTHLVCIL